MKPSREAFSAAYQILQVCDVKDERTGYDPLTTGERTARIIQWVIDAEAKAKAVSSDATQTTQGGLGREPDSASLQQKIKELEEERSIQDIANEEGLLQCRALLNVQDGDNLYDASQRL
jgi:hypothetical protein